MAVVAEELDVDNGTCVKDYVFWKEKKSRLLDLCSSFICKN